MVASRRYGNHLGVEFGACYRSGAVLSDGTEPPEVEDSYSDYFQSASPGCRAPHVWLGGVGGRLSSLQLLGPRFTVLAAAEGGAWRETARQVSADLGVPVGCSVVGSAGLRQLDGFAAAYGLDEDGAVLVRPDGHVAWRHKSGVAAPAELREACLATLFIADHPESAALSHGHPGFVQHAPVVTERSAFAHGPTVTSRSGRSWHRPG